MERAARLQPERKKESPHPSNQAVLSCDGIRTRISQFLKLTPNYSATHVGLIGGVGANLYRSGDH